MKNTLLFDLDNTLYDEQTAHKAAMVELSAYAAKKMDITPDYFKRLYKDSQKQIKVLLKGTASAHNRVLYLQRLVENFHKTVTPELILDFYKIYWDTFTENAKLLDEAYDTLKTLKEMKFKIAIVTDLTAFVQLRKVAHLKLTPFIDYIVSSEETGADKPHPSNYLLALDKLGSVKENAVIIGDNPETDITGAENLHITSVWLKFGQYAENYTGDIKADFEIKKLSELLTNRSILELT